MFAGSECIWIAGEMGNTLYFLICPLLSILGTTALVQIFITYHLLFDYSTVS